MFIPIWVFVLLISIGGALLIFSRASDGYMDFSVLFFGPLALAFFFGCWAVYGVLK